MFGIPIGIGIGSDILEWFAETRWRCLCLKRVSKKEVSVLKISLAVLVLLLCNPGFDPRHLVLMLASLRSLACAARGLGRRLKTGSIYNVMNASSLVANDSSHNVGAGGVQQKPSATAAKGGGVIGSSSRDAILSAAARHLASQK
jgi:hypothetical protein